MGANGEVGGSGEDILALFSLENCSTLTGSLLNLKTLSPDSAAEDGVWQQLN